MNCFKAGIVGCGNIGGRYDERKDNGDIYTHAGMYRTIGEFQLVCAADTDVPRLHDFGTYWKVPRLYSDPYEMFKNETLDIISIASPDETHHSLILDAIKHNPPRIIFTEKPLAMSPESAFTIYEEARKKNVAIVVDYIRRWDRNHQDIKRHLQEGGLGPLQAIVAYYVRGLRHNGCQMINLFQFLFGKIKTVQAMGPVNGGSLHGDPTLSLWITFEGGEQAAMIGVDRKGYGFSIYEIDILGQKGRLRLTDGTQEVEFYTTQDDSQFPNFKKLVPSESPWEASSYGSAMIRAGGQFVSYLQGETRRLHNTAQEAIDDLCVIEAALSSAKNDNHQTCVARYDTSYGERL